jgi:undecaprenyl-diphosphatase
VVVGDGAIVKVMQAISWLGSGVALTVLAAAAIVWLLRARRFSLAIFVALSGIGATVLSSVVKTLVDRPRPSVAQVAATGPSFPPDSSSGRCR